MPDAALGQHASTWGEEVPEHLSAAGSSSPPRATHLTNNLYKPVQCSTGGDVRDATGRNFRENLGTTRPCRTKDVVATVAGPARNRA